MFQTTLSGRQRGNSLSVFHRNSLKYASDREVKSTEIELKLYRERHTELRTIAAPSYKQLNTLTTSETLVAFYGDFLCHLKVNRDTVTLFNCLWKSKNGKRLLITALSLTKIDQLDGFRLPWRSLSNFYLFIEFASIAHVTRCSQAHYKMNKQFSNYANYNQLTKNQLQLQ